MLYDDRDGRIKGRISWPAIFAGTFVFLAILVTFGLLGTAIFASAVNPSSAHPLAGMSVGMGIWLIVLSIISLYFGGRTAAVLSATRDSHLGMYHGLTTFGFSVFTSMVVTALMLGSTMTTPATADAASPATVGHVVATAGYWVFFALLLGMIAAGIGGSQGATRNPRVLREEGREEVEEETGMRRVA